MPTDALLLYMRTRQKRPGSTEAQSLIDQTRLEAAHHGATLHSAGRGGLPPVLALEVFRRDEWRCKRCGGMSDLALHHKGGIFASTWLRSKGHAMMPNNLVVICGTCHDAIHDEARTQGIDSGQQPQDG